MEVDQRLQVTGRFSQKGLEDNDSRRAAAAPTGGVRWK